MSDDTTTTRRRQGGGSSAGMILGILALIIVLAGLWYFAMGPGSAARHHDPGDQPGREHRSAELSHRGRRLLPRSCCTDLDDAPDGTVGRIVRHHDVRTGGRREHPTARPRRR